MPVKLSSEVKDLKTKQKQMEQIVKDLKGTPMLKAVRTSTLLVTASAKKGLDRQEGTGGVDSGRLRASITPEVEQQGNEITGIVGTNVSYAPFVEEDTRPHWPPIKALELWAKRHHMVAFLVARAISQRGTKGVHFLEQGVKENEEKIMNLISSTVEMIFNKGGK